MKALRYASVVLVCAALFAPPATEAATLTLDLSTAVVTGGAGFIANEGRLKFDANTPGQTATFTFPSVQGEQYSITLTGQNNQSTSFFQFLIDADGAGPGGFVQLGSNFNFGTGFNRITLPAFTDVGTSDFFRIVNGGTANNSAGQISGISVVAVPGPLVGAGIPGLVLACGVLMILRRRRHAQS